MKANLFQEQERSQVLQAVADVPRVNILGVGISAVNMETAVHLCMKMIAAGERGYVAVTGVHGISEAQQDPELRTILNRAFLCVPDGMPTVWIGRACGHSTMRRVYGPDFMLQLCRASADKGCRHFLYGGNTGVAEQLAAELRRRLPSLQIVGTYTPPFRALDKREEEELAALIEACNPDVIWVGLSTPKQERFMAKYSDRLCNHLMVGVGAAFDIHTGRIKDAPAWVKNMGHQWLHRLLQEPSRLWRRYLINNPRFIWRVALQAMNVRKYRME